MTSSAKEIRRSFLQYFERHHHRVVPSSPLVPHDDPTLLFTNAGMNQFKDVFLGREKRGYTRAATAQKCMRVSGKHNDLENVGPSLRHHTFFEMLGNFSFGDYFKQEAIPFAWELLTKEWKLPPERLYATVFKGEAGIPRDADAYDVWAKFLPAERIGELGSADNFWQMGETGPCGRCSEIYYYRGADIPCADEGTGGCRGLECSCDRYIEIWNNVFMEFDRQADGTHNLLPAPSIDTGMGLERITAVLQGHLSNYDTDLFTPILDRLGELAGLVYGATKGLPPMPDVPAASEAPSRMARAQAVDISMRVVADHIRATTFLIGDGVRPSNEGRGYVLRRIMRRAMRHGQRLGLEQPLLHLLVNAVVDEFGDAYPELKPARTRIIEEVRGEENKFEVVLREGLPKLERVLQEAEQGNRVVPGQVAFHLYDTFGVPRDFIEDMIENRKLTLDREGFDRAMEGQRDKARATSKFKSSKTPDAWYVPNRQEIDALKDTFEGYDAVRLQGIPIALLYDDRPVIVPLLREGQSGYIVLPKTPFYIEAGGQVSDTGRIIGPEGEAEVDGLGRIPVRSNFPRVHRVRVTSGELRGTDLVTAEVNAEIRDATRRNHTATHLLHAALRQVLGADVKQKGSLVAPDRLRFDFVHAGAVTREQRLEIERIVNEHVLRNIPVQTEVRDTQEAIAAGAMALFGEKYGDSVRVVSIPGFSVELCGGTHVRATGDIGMFAVVSESGVAAGIRRIEAVTGMVAVERAQLQSELFEALLSAVLAAQEPPSIAALLAATGGPDPHKETRLQAARAIEAVLRLHTERKRIERENQHLKLRAALGGAAGGPSDEVIDIAGVKLIAREVSGLDKDGLRALVDQHRDRIKSGVVVLASPSDGKVTIVVGVTPDLTKKVPAGQVVKQIAPIVGGGGGGRPDFAEAGGKDPSKIGEMLAAARGVIEKMLS